MADGRIWLRAKIPPNKHIIAAYGTAIAGLPTQIAYGGGVGKHHSIALWQHKKN